MMIPKERCSQNTILFSDIRLRSGNQRRASGYGISRRAVHHAADRFTCRVPHPGIHGMHPLPVRDSAKHLYRPFQQRTGTGERVSHAPYRHGYVFPFAPFYQRAQMYLNNELLCVEFLKAKQTELYFLLNCYYTLKEIANFYAPIYRYSQTFRYFVMQNYLKAKDVESFAQLGGYSTITFRRLFKDTFGEPAYQWMTKKKCLDIQNDLITTNASISEICYKYGFESLSNFSHFCRANFGKSPRAIRNERDENV